MIFLQTTAIENFLKHEKQEIILLGEWCKKNFNVDSNEQVMPFFWTNSKQMLKEAQKCWGIYDEVLKDIVGFLNTIHQLNQTERYWALILGDWLYTFIQVVYDRYMTLKAFIERYPIFETILLSPNCFVTPLEYSDFVDKLSNDEYNLQLYSQILVFMGYEFDVTCYDLNQKSSYKITKNKKKSFLFKIINLLGKSPTATVTNPYFSNIIRGCLKLIWEAKGSVLFDDFEQNISIQMNIDYNQRKKILDVYKGDDTFKKLLFHLLPNNFPLLFIEGYHQIKSAALRNEKPKTLIYITGNGLYSNYLYKLWIAEYINNIKLVSIQHGGGYGVDLFHSPEKYERKVVDKFFTWGWCEDENTIPIAHEKISKKISHKKDGYILFLQTSNPKFIMRLQNSYNSSALNLIYIPKAISFFEYVGNIKRFVYRGYKFDNGFQIASTITSKFPEMLIDDHSASFHIKLKNARLFVCDHMATTYLETLALNFPTIIFIDKNFYSFRHPELIKLLVDACILFYDEKKAAEHLNSIYDDIDGWWYSNNVQKAREVFCKYYASESTNWARDWVNAFETVLEH